MRGSRLLGRLGLVSVGLVLGLIALEGVLQLGAVVVRATGREAPEAFETGKLRILCLGDSNTYGVYVDREKAYPQQLEALWNASEATPGVEVLNLGFPGTNSSRLLKNLPGMLETFEPDVVIVLVGANDYWTRPVPVGPALVERRSPLELVEQHSRVWKLGFMLRRMLRSEELDVSIDQGGSAEGETGTARYGGREFELGYEKGGQLDRPYEGHAQNLWTTLNLIRKQGAKPVVLTYASHYMFYRDANVWLRRVAQELKVPVVDMELLFTERCPDGDCSEWFFWDQHPSAKGYELMARTIVEQLRPK